VPTPKGAAGADPADTGWLAGAPLVGLSNMGWLPGAWLDGGGAYLDGGALVTGGADVWPLGGSV
jgi:hypothetical protein